MPDKAKQIACPNCDLLFNKVDLGVNQVAKCNRCSEILYYETRDFRKSIALLFASLIIYFPAMLLPFLIMRISGMQHEISILGSVFNIKDKGISILGLSVFIMVILIPFLRIFFLLLITLPIQLKKKPLLTKKTIRIIARMSPWGMVEVYLIGVIVTLVKLVSLADIKISYGFYAFILLVILNALISANIPTKRIWQEANDQ